MASAGESSLLSELELSESPGIYAPFSSYLLPFSDLKNDKPKRSKDPSQIRPLAKKFLSFLNRSLSVLPKRLSDPQKVNEEFARELFDIYRLCLDCLEAVSSQLSCKPYSVHVQRVRMLHCMEAWGWHCDAEAEGFRVLESFKGIDFGLKKSGNAEGKLVLDVENGGDDKDFALLVVEVVVTLVKCAAMRRIKDGEVYERVLRLVEEARPWLRVLDANAREKLHRMLVTCFGKCSLFLLGEVACFDGNLVFAFCRASLSEYSKSSLKDNIYKFAQRICSSLFLLQENRSLLIIDILICVLGSVSQGCEFETESIGNEYAELVSYCAGKCRTGGPNLCITMAKHIKKLADDSNQVKPPFDMILRAYAAGLCLSNCDAKSRDSEVTTAEAAKHESAIKILCDNAVALQDVVAQLGSLGYYFQIGNKKNCVTSSVKNADSVGQVYSELSFACGACRTFTDKNRKAHMLSYLHALKFLCVPLAELVNSQRKQILSENEDCFVASRLCVIQDAFHHFADIFLSCQSCTYESGGDASDGSSRAVLSVAVASFTLSIKSKLNMKRSVHLIKQIIAAEWIKSQGLKHLFTSLHNIGVSLYRNKQVKEASKALKLCYRASWTCVKRLCQVFVLQSEGFVGDLSEDGIIEFVGDACTRSAFLLDVLHQCGSQKVKRTLVESLEGWCVARKVLERLPGPVPLVRQWVKIECYCHENVDERDTVPTLYCLLSSSLEVSKRIIGIILEQELLAYEEMNALCPDFCEQMQMKIIGILLQDVYITPDSRLQKSRILMRKGRALRVRGIEGLEDCIQCLSDSIATIKEVNSETCGPGISTCHQLAVTYCLRALCIQEAESNSKQILQDINAALNLWLSISFPDQCSAGDLCFMVPENIVPLLYNIIDLLSMKGCVDLHHDIYRLMTRLFKWKNVPLESCLSMLWKCRRTTHALCISPVNEALIMVLSDHCGELSQSVDFWIRCLKGSQPLVVGFQQSFSFLFSNSHSSCYQNKSFRSDISVDEVKEAASELISSAPVPSHSVFFAGFLYYDLSERLVSNGRLFEALSYAKEAHRLRTKLFQEKFMCSVEQPTERYNEIGDITEKPTYSIKNLQIYRTVASEIWLSDTIPWDLEGCYLSPWNVLQCYLESTLQVGIIHEMIGNGSKAETFLIWGKNISCLQSLPLFIVAFSCILGNLYRKKRLSNLAEKELQSAKKILTDTSLNFSCMKCRLMLEATVDQHLGDLSRSNFDINSADISVETLSRAEKMYKLALDKLNLSVWKNCVSCSEEADAGKTLKRTLVKDVECGASYSSACLTAFEQDTRSSTSEQPKAKLETKTCRKNARKPSLKEKCVIPENNSRVTRSRSRSTQNQSMSKPVESQICTSGYLEVNNAFDYSDMPGQGKLVPEMKSCTVALGCEVKCISNNMRCWQCILMAVIESGSMNNFINMKWEAVRRRLLLRVLIGIGKCFRNCGQLHETHKVLCQNISLLVSRNPFDHTHSSVPLTSLLDYIGKEIPGDFFTVERAMILYNICWLALKSFRTKDTRKPCCDLSNINLEKLVSWLMLAFVLCREVPMLLQKVSQLLATIYVLSATTGLFPLFSSSKTLSNDHWASFFHQASLGPHLYYQFLSRMTWRSKVEDAEASSVPGSTCEEETSNRLRLAPDSVQDLEEFVTEFFAGFPGMTVVCISLLGCPHSNLLKDLLLHPTHAREWMLVSRLNSECQPIVLLLPVDPVTEAETSEDDASPGSGKLCKSKELDRHWHCPWGSSVVDDVAPVYKLILEENYLSSSKFPFEDTEGNRTLWWMCRQKLDCRLAKFLRNLEDSWFGPWKYVLLGELSDWKRLELVRKKLVRDLRSKCKLDINEGLLKIILGASKYASEDACISQLCLRVCHIGRVGYFEEACGSSPSASCEVNKQSELAVQLIEEAMSKLKVEDSVKREPVVLVLDHEVQMLPWENLPILRNQEVYRMPSVGSISVALERSHHHQPKLGKIVGHLPLIDPLDSFYLLNPSGDLESTQVEFENWFRDKNLKGRAGSAPTAEELVVALTSHDLFTYFGHGSGAQYIPGHEFQRLKNCAAALLMGCSSGALTLNGCYIPEGIPLSYLEAGSPVIVANLWEVTDKDIDRFGKAMLNAWLRERSSLSSGCAQCNLVAEELEAMTIKGNKGNGKRKTQRKNSRPSETCETNLSKDFCDHGARIGSFMSQAREACRLPFLIGASPVCYGIPTGIRRKKDL